MCHPLGFTFPISPRSSVGISSGQIFANATPHLPSLSRSLYSSNAVVDFFSSSVKRGILSFNSTYASPIYSG